MLLGGYGTAEEQPEQQVMVDEKGVKNIASFIFVLFSEPKAIKPRGVGQSPIICNYYVFNVKYKAMVCLPLKGEKISWQNIAIFVKSKEIQLKIY